MRRSKSKKLAKKKADKYFSKYIRERDTDHRNIGKCITCGEFKPKDKLDCGHFISRRFMSTRYDERNAHAQCSKCNRFQNGNQYAHGKAIDRKYGKGTADDLYQTSRMVSKPSQDDFERTAKHYKEKLESL